MQKITQREARTLGFYPESDAKLLEQELGKCAIGEGVVVTRDKWKMASHPMNVARHRALYRKNSPIYKFKFKGKRTAGTSKKWETYIIMRVA